MAKTFLKDLEIGDIFHSAKDKNGNYLHRSYVVRGHCVFNRGHGSATRACVNISRRLLESKSCRMEVIKEGESVHKKEYKQNPLTV
jgi:hypothetical protein